MIVLLCAALGSVACRGGPDGAGGPDLWRPELGTTWFIQLTGDPDLDHPVDVYDVDYETTDEVVTALHARGKRVIAYVPVGNWEPFRADAEAFPEDALCGPIPGWDERYVDVRRPEALVVIRARIAATAARGFDGMEGDIVDLHLVETGCDPPISESEMTATIADLTAFAQGLGLAYFAKNVPESAAAWSAIVDGVIVEEAYQYGEQAAYAPYVAAGKPVYAIEYGQGGPTPAQCTDATARGYALFGTDLALTGKIYGTCW